MVSFHRCLIAVACVGWLSGVGASSCTANQYEENSQCTSCPGISTSDAGCDWGIHCCECPQEPDCTPEPGKYCGHMDTTDKVCKCGWQDDWLDDGLSAAFPSCIIVAVIAIVGIVLTSMIACCGKMVPKRKLVGGIFLAVGMLSPIIPMLVGTAACSLAIDKHCTLSEAPTYTEDASAACSIIVTFVIYISIGWLNIITGGVVFGMACACLCGCCKAKGAAPVIVAGTAAVVMAQPMPVQATTVQAKA